MSHLLEKFQTDMQLRNFSLKPRKRVNVTLNWRATPVDGDYRVIVRLVAPQPSGGLLVAEDTGPRTRARRPCWPGTDK